MSSSRAFASSCNEPVNILIWVCENVHTVQGSFHNQPLQQTAPAKRLCEEQIQYTYDNDDRGELLAVPARVGNCAPLIMPTGLLILRAAFSIKYGMRPWTRFIPANASEALSAATNRWKTVDASLQRGGFRSGRLSHRATQISDSRDASPLDDSLVVRGEVADIRRMFDGGEDVREPI